MLEAGSTKCGEIVKEKVNHIIANCFHLENKKRQIYKNKKTIVKVIAYSKLILMLDQKTKLNKVM